MLGQQGGYTKFPCFLCLWDSRADDQHYTKRDWPLREQLEPGRFNVLKKPLVHPSKTLLPPLHMKLELVKQFVKGIPKGKRVHEFPREKFPKVSDMKLKAGIFDDRQIRELSKDDTFVTAMTETEASAWNAYKSVV